MPGKKKPTNPTENPESLDVNEVLAQQQSRKDDAVEKVSKTKDKSKVKSSSKRRTLLDSDVEEAEQGPVHYTANTTPVNSRQTRGDSQNEDRRSSQVLTRSASRAANGPVTRPSVRPVVPPAVASTSSSVIGGNNSSSSSDEDPSQPPFEDPWEIKKRRKKMNSDNRKKKRSKTISATKQSPRKAGRRKKRTTVVEMVTSDSDSSSQNSGSDSIYSDPSDSSDDEDVVEGQAPTNNPRLPKGNDKNVTLDQCLSDKLVKKIAKDRFFDINKVYSCLVELDPADQDLVPVNLGKGRVGYRSVRESQKVRNLPQYLRAMLTVGACYLKLFPDRAPAFCQYLFHMIDADRDYTFPAVLKYDRQFRTFRAHHPQHSWAKELWNYKLKLGTHVKTHVQAQSNTSLQPSTFKSNNFSYNSPLSRVPQRNYNQSNSFQSNGPRNNFSRPSYPCRNFNNGSCKYGLNCRFNHVCETCSKPGHGSCVCRLNQNLGQNQNSSQNTKYIKPISNKK